MIISAEELMRSRYDAYVKCDIDYLMKTTLLEKRDFYNIEGMKNWALNSKWLKLEIIETIKGGEFDNDGVVEFKAYYLENEKLKIHHEVSNFKRVNGIWFYVNGVIKEDNLKIARNSLCPCGSDKKYKKCCEKR